MNKVEFWFIYENKQDVCFSTPFIIYNTNKVYHRIKLGYTNTNNLIEKLNKIKLNILNK